MMTLIYPTHGKPKKGRRANSSSMIRCCRCGLYYPVDDIPAFRWIESKFDGKLPKLGCNRCVRSG